METECHGTLQSLAAEGDQTAHLIWRNGNLVPWGSANIHVNAVGHASVAAIFEGIKAYSGSDGQVHVFRLADHLRRFADSIKVCRLRLAFSEQDLADGVLALLRANQARRDIYVRPWIFPEGIFREHITPAWAQTEVLIDSWPFLSSLPEPAACRACVASWSRVGSNSMPARVKAFSNYHNSRLAVIEARANGYDWPIFLNAREQVTEGPGACLALVRRGQLITPDLASGVLEGITRDTLLHLAAKTLGIQVCERSVDRGELYIADELFFMGTGWEILPISSLDGLPIADGQVGPVTQALSVLYNEVVRGQHALSSKWCSAVW